MRLLAELAIVAVAAIGVAVALALLPATASTRRRRATPREPSRPEQLVAIERLVSTAATSAIQAHAYLRPVLVEIVSRRLAGRGRNLEQMRESVGQGLLGDRLWEIVRPNRPFPDHRYAPGVSRQELSAILDVIERL